MSIPSLPRDGLVDMTLRLSFLYQLEPEVRLRVDIFKVRVRNFFSVLWEIS
jgi:hypothetical protein